LARSRFSLLCSLYRDIYISQWACRDTY
jgi:hypothetical protein